MKFTPLNFTNTKVVFRKDVHPIGIWDLEMLILKETGKPENPEKNLLEQSKEPTATLSRAWTRVRNRARDTSVEGECNHHFAIPAPLRQSE